MAYYEEVMIDCIYAFAKASYCNVYYLKVGNTASTKSRNFSHKIINEMMSLTYGELELLICLHFPMAATRINKEGVSL